MYKQHTAVIRTPTAAMAALDYNEIKPTAVSSRDKMSRSRKCCECYDDEQHDFLFWSALSAADEDTPMPRGPGLVGDKSSSSGLSSVCFCDTTL